MARKQHEESEDEDYEETESICSDSSGSVHTSDDEDGQTGDGIESGDEIAAAATIVPTKVLYYRYISTDPVPMGAEKYKPVRVGPLHIGTPEATDQLPEHHKDYSVLQGPDGEFISALRYRKDPAATIEEYYFFSNQVTWQAQTRRLLKNCKMGMTVLANLSLWVHNMTDGVDCDKTLLQSDDLRNYCDDHILDTPHAKKIIAKAAKSAAAKAEKKKAALSSKTDQPATPKKRKAEETSDAEIKETTPNPAKKKKPGKKAAKQTLTPAIVVESPSSPSKTGTTPTKSPSVKAKPKSRQLQLTAKGKASPTASPKACKTSACTKRLVLKSRTVALSSVLPAMQRLMDEMGVYGTLE